MRALLELTIATQYIPSTCPMCGETIQTVAEFKTSRFGHRPDLVHSQCWEAYTQRSAMPRPDRSTQVRISRTTADALRKLAADLGYVQTRGILAGELGSIAQMFDAVAQGKLAVVDPHTIDAAIARRIWPAQDHSERIRTWNEAIQAARSAVAVEMKGVRLSGESPHSDADSGAAPTPDPDRAHQDAQNG